jgi:hypothetical protein
MAPIKGISFKQEEQVIDQIINKKGLLALFSSIFW